jgi:hypothetical protein
MRGKVIVGALLVAVAAVVYFAFFAGSDEEKIRKVIGRLSHAVELRADDSNALVRIARARGELDEVLDADVHVSIAELPGGGARHGRAEISELAAQATMAFRTAEIDVHDLDIKIDQGHTTAKVAGSATLRGTTRSGEGRRDERSVDFLLRKDGGSWRVTSVTVWPPDGRT